MEYWFLPFRLEARLRGLPDRNHVFIPEISLNAGALWSAACIVGFLAIPVLITVFVHRAGPASIGMTTRGFFRHVWVYLLLYAAMLPLVLHVADRPDFQDTYPFVAQAARDRTVFFKWQAVYLAQFFALEAFFRGYLLFTLERSMGAVAIFVMAMPYGMIHWHKPPLEAFGAIIAGVVLGALALRFRSFFGGALLHGLVALTIEVLAARRGGAI